VFSRARTITTSTSFISLPPSSHFVSCANTGITKSTSETAKKCEIDLVMLLSGCIGFYFLLLFQFSLGNLLEFVGCRIFNVLQREVIRDQRLQCGFCIEY